jgi:hypothetical protein
MYRLWSRSDREFGTVIPPHNPLVHCAGARRLHRKVKAIHGYSTVEASSSAAPAPTSIAEASSGAAPATVAYYCLHQTTGAACTVLYKLWMFLRLLLRRCVPNSSGTVGAPASSILQFCSRVGVHLCKGHIVPSRLNIDFSFPGDSVPPADI